LSVALGLRLLAQCFFSDFNVIEVCTSKHGSLVLTLFLGEIVNSAVCFDHRDVLFFTGNNLHVCLGDFMPPLNIISVVHLGAIVAVYSEPRIVIRVVP